MRNNPNSKPAAFLTCATILLPLLLLLLSESDDDGRVQHTHTDKTEGEQGTNAVFLVRLRSYFVLEFHPYTPTLNINDVQCTCSYRRGVKMRVLPTDRTTSVYVLCDLLER